VVDILTAVSGLQSSDETPSRDRSRRLTEWRSALSPKLEYIHVESTSTPLTPPAFLLQMTHFTTSLASSPSQIRLQRVLELMDICQEHFGLSRLPPVVMCLLESVRESCQSLPLDQATQTRISTTIANLRKSQSPHTFPEPPGGLVSTYAREQFSRHGLHQASPQANPPRLNPLIASQSQQQPSNSISLLDELLPDMHTGQQLQVPPSFSPNAVEPDFTSPGLDAYDPSISGDLDSFFDELASLHGAKKLQNQPQFMQNLGFAPEISMADLLATQSGQYMPMEQATFRTDHENEPLQFPLSDYYNAG
jgi:hypothetical protein